MELDQEVRYLRRMYGCLKLLLPIETRFCEFPLSRKTLKGLTDFGFITSTEIQRETIPHALLGRNVVTVGETGSGKTLSFLIPVLEHMFINKRTRSDGLACLIISPTREIAYQIFETLRSIGKYHDFSAGLIIGGRNLKFERSRMDQCNVLVCTPGRLLQHMDGNPLFNACNMELLVLDEADRCLDLGFAQSFEAILKNLPLIRQTLLVSATVYSAQILTRLNLQNPTYVGKHWQTNQGVAVPKLLKQNYVVVELEEKITVLWSFIKSHCKQKILIFLASCKQVKYVYEIFSRLRPGISLLALYGTLSQDRRISIYNEFFKRRNGVLLATDVASRGLDFPDVNWVVQLDCPEDVSQYVHRGGRSARNNAHGENLLVLLPSEEEEMIKELKTHCIELQKVEIDAQKLMPPNEKIKNFCVRSPELKRSAQRAFIAYVKSVFLMKNKTIFSLNGLHINEFAESLGLMSPPRIRFLEKYSKRQPLKFSEKRELPKESFLTIKKADQAVFDNFSHFSKETTHLNKSRKTITKANVAKKTIKKKIRPNQFRRFDEKGNVTDDRENYENGNCLDIKYSKSFMIQQDIYDKIRFHKIVKSRHRKIKAHKNEKVRKCLPKKATESSPNSNFNLLNSNSKSNFKLINSNSKQVNKTLRNKQASNTIETKLTEDIAWKLLSNT